MRKLPKNEIIEFIEPRIQAFHRKRLDGIRELQLEKILKRKNPYLFKAKHINLAQDLVKSLVDAHLSSQEEGIFGGFLEELAIFVCGRVYHGRKSTAEGIDLEFEKGDIKYIVSIKSAKEKNEQFVLEYGKVINKFTIEFGKEYCEANGMILWEKLVQFNSGRSTRK